MSISPFSARPASPGGEARRARLALAIAIVGIGATLLAYALSPGVRHAVSHAAHSVKHAAGVVLDKDPDKAAHPKKPAKHAAKRATGSTGHPAAARPSGSTGSGGTAGPAGSKQATSPGQGH